MPFSPPKDMVLGCCVSVCLFFEAKLPAANGDENWYVPAFQAPLKHGEVEKLTVFKGNLYAAGRFCKAGGIWTTNLARWDGSNWWPMLDNVVSRIAALAAGDTHLYVLGEFIRAGTTNSVSLLRFDGAELSDGPEVPRSSDGSAFPIVNAMAASGTDLYIGGWFNGIGGVRAGNIARWDGNSWHPLGDGIDLGVTHLAVAGRNLFAARSIFGTGGSHSIDLFRWDGTNWLALGGGLKAPYGTRFDISTMLAVDNQLFVAGFFPNAGGKAITNLARWTGSSWTGLGDDKDAIVQAMASDGAHLYAAGQFRALGGVNARNVARWDGTGWSALGDGVGGRSANISALCVSDGSLYAGGTFTRAGSANVNSVAHWNGLEWSGLGEGVMARGEFRALTATTNTLYAGGEFFNLGGAAISNVARWNGSNWMALGNGVNRTVRAAITHRDHLYVGGDFSQADGLPARRIAKWNGANWKPLGTGVDFSVTALAVFRDQIIAGGSNATAAAASVACWTGQYWKGLLSANHRISVRYVHEIKSAGNRLFALADVVALGNPEIDTLVQWDGTNWALLRTDSVQAFTTYKNEIYAAWREYDPYGFERSVHISQWQRGGGWSTAVYTRGPINLVRAMTVVADDFYVSGSTGAEFFLVPTPLLFEVARSQKLRPWSFAKWDGLEWTPLGSGTDRPAAVLLRRGSNIFWRAISRERRANPRAVLPSTLFLP